MKNYDNAFVLFITELNQFRDNLETIVERIHGKAVLTSPDKDSCAASTFMTQLTLNIEKSIDISSECIELLHSTDIEFDEEQACAEGKNNDDIYGNKFILANLTTKIYEKLSTWIKHFNADITYILKDVYDGSLPSNGLVPDMISYYDRLYLIYKDLNSFLHQFADYMDIGLSGSTNVVNGDGLKKQLDDYLKKAAQKPNYPMSPIPDIEKQPYPKYVPIYYLNDSPENDLCMK